LLPASIRSLRQASLGELLRSDTGRAAGMAAAVMVGNVLALGFTVVFARKLGQEGYGSLSALISTYIILMVPGSALQTTVARDVSAQVAAGDPHAGAGVRRWLGWLMLVTLVASAVSVAARDVLATAIGVDEIPWAAAATVPSGCLWLIVAVQRGALQGFQRYRAVSVSWIGEQIARFAFAIALVGPADVTGAFLGTPLALAAVAVALLVPLGRLLPRLAPAREHTLGALFVRAGAPVAALALVAWMQDGNVILVKHVASSRQAGSYAAAAVAAKAVMWIAVGLGLFLVPEAARRARLRQRADGVLASTLGLIALVGVPMVLLYAVAGEQLMKLAFGHKFAGGADPLPWLGVAFTLLACTYLAVQYHLALHRWRFVALLAVAAVVQPIVVVAVGPGLVAIALALMAVNASLALLMVILAFRVATHPETVVPDPESAGDPVGTPETLA
jgi:O-antigen/teichoic acid export membrane protein